MSVVLKRFFLVLLGSLAANTTLHAQTIFTAWRMGTYPVADTITLDTATIIPNSVIIVGSDMSSKFTVRNNKIIFAKKPNADSVVISYRVFQYPIQKVYMRKNSDSITQHFGSGYSYGGLDNINSSNKIIDEGELAYSGSLSRNLSFGNAQDVVLNSQFNLQMNGMLADSIIITAAITDNNVPFQPQGNTQRLQEFDRVYISATKRNATLLLGDYEMFRPQGYFMNFYKRVQGAYFSNSQLYGKHYAHKYAAGASLAKGKFVRQQLAVQEGNQGPYKLIGPNGETFFIVLANSERVIVDGLVMQRGEDLDYVIDYNTAEIIFMPRCMMHKDRRVIIEYEFNDRNYLNSLLYTTHEFSIGKNWQAYTHIYSNQDARNQPFQQILTEQQKQLLANIGDNIDQAYAITAVQDTAIAGKVYYNIIDTTVAGQFYDTVFQYTPLKTSTSYVINFSFVGPGKGDYVIDKNTANGRVYQWIAPQAGQHMGEYMPYTLLVTPKRLQMYVAGARYKVDTATDISCEVALSNNDPNLFSKIDNQNHLGAAVKVNANHRRVLVAAKKVVMNTQGSYEYVAKQFRPLERFRSTEFSRDWTVDFAPLAASEHLANARIGIEIANKAELAYEVNTFTRGSVYDGLRHIVHYRHRIGTININAQYNSTDIATNTYDGTFTRPMINIEWQPKNTALVVGTKCSLERANLRDVGSGDLRNSAFAFNVAETYIRSKKADKGAWHINYFVREDLLPSNNGFKAATLSHNIGSIADVINNQHQTLRTHFTYRQLFVHDTNLYKNKSEISLLSRVEHGLNLFKGAITTNSLYEFGSGQELRREVTYIEVPVGKGDYAWNDYNGDAIQQLNEFEIAQFPDQRRFIRVFTPSNQYVRVHYSNANFAVQLNPKQVISKDAKGTLGVIKRFSMATNVQLSVRTFADAALQLLPWQGNLSDTALLAQNSIFSNSIYFNRFSQKFSIDYQYQINQNKSLMTYGIDMRGNAENTIRVRYNITKQLTLIANLRKGNKDFDSKFLEGRNYDIYYQSAEPVFSLLTNRQKNRWQLSSKIDSRRNLLGTGTERSNSIAGSIEYKRAIAQGGFVELKGTVNDIKYNGSPNSSVGFIMLDGLMPGTNFLWSASIERRLGKGLEINLTYDARKSTGNTAVHTGRAGARAIF